MKKSARKSAPSRAIIGLSLLLWVLPLMGCAGVPLPPPTDPAKQCEAPPPPEKTATDEAGNPAYSDGAAAELVTWLEQKIRDCRALLGYKDEKTPER